MKVILENEENTPMMMNPNRALDLSLMLKSGSGC
jgi:hypothetical protein